MCTTTTNQVGLDVRFSFLSNVRLLRNPSRGGHKIEYFGFVPWPGTLNCFPGHDGFSHSVSLHPGV